MIKRETDTENQKANDDHHWWRQRDHLPVPAVVCGTPKGKRGLISKHVHYQLARCNKLYYYLLPPISKSLGIKYQGINNINNNNNADSFLSAILGRNCVLEKGRSPRNWTKTRKVMTTYGSLHPSKSCRRRSTVRQSVWFSFWFIF